MQDRASRTPTRSAVGFGHQKLPGTSRRASPRGRTASRASEEPWVPRSRPGSGWRAVAAGGGTRRSGWRVCQLVSLHLIGELGAALKSRRPWKRAVWRRPPALTGKSAGQEHAVRVLCL
jgi:phage-related protein